MESLTIGDVTIEIGDTLILEIDSLQLGEQITPEINDASPMQKGTELIVDSIGRYPDGVHINFETKLGSVTIYKFALENMFEDEYISFK